MKNVDHNKNADAMSNGDGSTAPSIVGTRVLNRTGVQYDPTIYVMF